jgi:hypothetical protein
MDNAMNDETSHPALQSKKYALTSDTPLGQGCWGIVYPGIDVETGQELAFKFPLRGEIAEAQMKERGLTPRRAARKESRSFAANAHVVPTFFEQDENGLEFIIMPRYPQFLDTYLDDTRARPKKKNLRATGLTIDEIARFGRDIATGISEFHRTEKRPHLDIKPDNIAVDEYLTLLLADFGNATFISDDPNHHRSNIGFKYTRAPWLFVEDKPRFSCDTFAFGSLLYKLFTDEYLLQKEIDAAGTDKQTLTATMQSYTDWGYGQREEFVRGKLKGKHIPKEFERVIIGCATGDIHDGAQLLHAYTAALSEHEQRKGIKRFVRTTQKFLAAGVLVGVLGAGAYNATKWATFFAPEPDYASRVDLTGQIAMRAADLSTYKLQAEMEYPPIDDVKRSAKDVHRFEVRWEKRMITPSIGERDEAVKGQLPPSLAHIMIDEYVRTIDQLGYVFDPETGEAEHADGIGGLQNRNYPEIRQQLERAPGISSDAFGDLVKIAEYALGANRIIVKEWDSPGYIHKDTKRIDLEDACVTILFGGDQLTKYQRMARSHTFTYTPYTQGLSELQYRRGYSSEMGSSWGMPASRTAKGVGSGSYQEFLQQYMHNIQQRVKTEIEQR